MHNTLSSKVELSQSKRLAAATSILDIGVLESKLCTEILLNGQLNIILSMCDSKRTSADLQPNPSRSQ